MIPEICLIGSYADSLLSSKLVIITMPKYKEVWVFQEGNGLIWQSIVTTEIWRICILKEFTLTQFSGMILNVTYYIFVYMLYYLRLSPRESKEENHFIPQCIVTRSNTNILTYRKYISTNKWA